MNLNNDTVLHIACKQGKLDIVKILVVDRQCEVNYQNKDGTIALHIACEQGYLDIVKILAGNKRSKLNQKNSFGITPLLIACERRHWDIVKYLAVNRQCEVNCMNLNNDTVLHIACKQSKSNIVKLLVVDRQCEVNCQNKAGIAPLHIAYGNWNLDITQILLACLNCDVNSKDTQGNTILHHACIRNDVKTVKLILSTGLANPQLVNNHGHTPAELTSEYKILQELSSYVARKKQFSLQTYIKIFVMGNPGVGKSTLIKAICEEISRWKSVYLFGSRKMVSDVELHTAGIIPISFQSKDFGNTVIYDFAGQYEYYSSHAAVLKASVPISPPLFIVVVNLSEMVDEISQKVKYWYCFICNCCPQSSVSPHMIIIASHADKVKSTGEDPEKKLSQVVDCFNFNNSIILFMGSVVMDCRLLISNGLDQLRSLIVQSCIALRKTSDIDFRCHTLDTFLVKKFNGHVACTARDIATAVSEQDILLPQSTVGLLEILSNLSGTGHCLFLRNSDTPEDSWVILQKEVLLSRVNGTIFAPEHFKQHKNFSESTGVVVLSRIRKEFPEYEAEMILQFLKLLEFCIDIDDQEALNKITLCGIPYDPSERYYFFPALVQVKNPVDVYLPTCTDATQYQSGWLLECHKDQFLTAHFLHVLILRLAFSFALPPDKRDIDPTSPVITRRCSVWKHGIAWLNRDGIQTIVEIGLQFQWVAVLICSPESKAVQCAKLRSSVICTVLKAKDDICSTCNIFESLLHPSCIHYPFTEKDHILYSLNEIRDTIAEKKSHPLDRTGKHSIEVAKLLLFEPYLGLDRTVLCQLFSSTFSEMEIQDKFLAEFASSDDVILKREQYEELIKPDPTALRKCYSQVPTDSVRQFIHLLHFLRDKCPTFVRFREELDKYSIFGGRLSLASVDDESTYSSGSKSPVIPFPRHTAYEADTVPTHEERHHATQPPTLDELIDHVKTIDWFRLGLKLGLQEFELEVIEKDNRLDTKGALEAMLRKWLRTSENLSWRVVVDALMAINDRQLASKIEKQFL